MQVENVIAFASEQQPAGLELLAHRLAWEGRRYDATRGAVSRMITAL